MPPATQSNRESESEAAGGWGDGTEAILTINTNLNFLPIMNPQPEGVRQAISLLKEAVLDYIKKHPSSTAATMDRELGVYAKKGYLLWTILEMLEDEKKVVSKKVGRERQFNLA